MDNFMQWVGVVMVAAGCGGGGRGCVMNPSVYTSVPISPSAIATIDASGNITAKMSGTVVVHCADRLPSLGCLDKLPPLRGAPRSDEF